VSWTGLLGALMFTVGPLWPRLGNYVLVIAHEGGHATVAMAFNGSVGGVRMYTDGSGVTHHWSADRARLPVALAGYLMPSALGLAVLALQHHSRPAVPLAVLLAALFAMLIVTRNLFGLLLVVLLGAAFYLTIHFSSASIQTSVAAGAGWIFLLGAVRDVLEIRHGYTPEGLPNDAEAAEELTGIPAVVWIVLMAALTLGALAYAAWLSFVKWS
jgi:Peptidase M50B-like